MGKNENQSVYIQSLQASQVWEHMNREREIDSEYVGMVPYSLELMKLKKVMKHVNKELKDDKLKIVSVKENKKQITDAVINLKFDSNVKSGEKIMDTLPSTIDNMKVFLEKMETKLNEEINDKKSTQLQKWIEKLKVDINERESIKEDIINNKKKEKWKQVSNDELRQILYKYGFTIKTVDKYTGDFTETKYKAYKRSSSKSRTGQCLFIHEAIYDDMIKWSRMGLKFEEGKRIDYASLLAYESLVGSSIEDTVTIDPKNILIVNDVFSSDDVDANVIKKDKKTGFLNSFPDKVKLTNNIFDGESLLDVKHFKNQTKSMLLLRNHMFKSAAFSTNIQLFMEEYAKDNQIDYDNWTVKDMFNNTIKVTDIEMITTPSSLKALKFAEDIFGKGGKDYTDKQLNKLQSKMYKHWKSVVRKDGKVFGVCKTEKASKRGSDGDNILQQMSYQMLNSVPLEYEDVGKLASYEKEYIKNLKDDDEKYIKYLDDTKNDVNSNELLVDLYNRNNNIVNTKLFRDFRKKNINKYVNHIKNGKIRLHGDYEVLFANGHEFLLHSIGKFDVENTELALNGHEVFTNLFPKGEYVCFRNPHVSPSNILVVKNVENDKMERYFNLSKNIVCINNVKTTILETLNGADMDSDTMAIFDSETLLNAVKNRVEGKYKVCINKIESEKVSYTPTMDNMAQIDNILSTSQKNIGTITNIAQQAMSKYWDGMENDGENLTDLLKSVDVMAILSGVAIDMSKKLYKIDLAKEIKNIDTAAIYKFKKVPVTEKDKKTGGIAPKVDKKTGEIIERNIKANPLFFQYIKESKTIKDRVVKYNTSMDYLFDVLKQGYAKHRKNIDFNKLLIDEESLKEIDPSDPDYKQQKKIMEYVIKMDESLKKIHVKI
uniref:hypothetical protein n=1 Tax=Oceanobacillus massiliensis TaxID=1465765 RepID=UPI00301AB282